MVEFRKRLTDDILLEINEMIAEYNTLDDSSKGDGNDESNDPSDCDGSSDSNRGTLILDAICALQQIEYPQDVNLLNDARENLEVIIDTVCYEYNYYKPRMHRQNARNDYLAPENVEGVLTRKSGKLSKASAVCEKGSGLYR